MKVEIDFENAVTRKSELWRGMGMVSANNSSRLLMDYKVLHFQKYQELLELIFGKKGLCIEHLKIEMGADINSSSGTEPCTMRYAEEKADVTRGAGFMLCADAKRINPNITLDMLWWGEPLWIEESENVYENRYQWYKSNLTEAYNKYQIKFDYVSATQNERGWDAEWIKFLSKKLKTDKNTVYDFSKIKIVAGEEVCTWHTADLMLSDSELLKAVDVIGSHYTSWSTNAVLKLREFGKEVWHSEGSSPMGYSEGLHKYDGNGSGLSGLNNSLDVANRIITMFACGKMTLYEFQPVVASYYDGVTYCHKQLITANTPWNGYYEFSPGFFMTLHFSRFFPRGWSMIETASYADGEPAGDGHSVGNSIYSFMTGCNPKTGDYSVVITNTTEEPINYEFFLRNNDKYKSQIYLYETHSNKLPDTLKKSEFVHDKNKFSICVNPYSIITISTLDINPLQDLQNYFMKSESNTILTLPFEENFDYKDFGDEFLKERGSAPLFTTDEGGAFEIVNYGKEKVLKQMIQRDKKNKEWGGTPDPVTNLGDDRWFNYSACISGKFSENSKSNQNYIGLGIRYNLPDSGKNGIWLQLFCDGKWSLNRNSQSIKDGILDNFDNLLWHQLYISAVNDLMCIRIDEKELGSFTFEELKTSMQGAGRVAVFSDYETNYFKKLSVKSLGENPYIVRSDNLDDCFKYIEDKKSHWEYGLMESFKVYKRTVSKGKKGSAVKFEFNGTGFNLTGNSVELSYIKVAIDGKVIAEKAMVRETGNRECLYFVSNLENEHHIVELEILEGALNIDSLEIRK